MFPRLQFIAQARQRLRASQGRLSSIRAEPLEQMLCGIREEISMSYRSKFVITHVALAFALAAICSSVYAERVGSVSKSAEPREGYEAVEMFAAMEAGQIEVKLIPKDINQANIFVVNKTDKPLAVKMPAAFAGVPVLAQGFGGGMGGMGGGMGGMGGGGMGGGGNQGVGGGMGGGGGGGGFGGGGGGMGGGGFGGGAFNIAAGKVGKVQVDIICLEHGKTDPNPRVEYKIMPIESFSDKPEIAEICKMMANDEISHGSAQASAWHLANGLSWEELAAKDRVRLSNGYTEKYFSYRTLLIAKQAIDVAAQRAKDTETKPYSSSQQTSASVTSDQQ
jgi:hypothetical protein